MGEFTDTLRRASVVPGPIVPPERIVRADAGDARGARPSSVQIPVDKIGDWVARAVLVEPEGPVAEQFRHTAIRARQEMRLREASVLLVTSAEPGAGKTTTACNLAIALATIAGGERVALVDLDLRRPSIARAWGLSPEVGLESALVDGTDPSVAAIGTDLPALDVFPVATPIRAAHEVLSGSRLDLLFERLKRWYSVIVCDTPPVLPVPDVPLLASHAGACLVVAKAGSTRRKEMRRLLEHIPRSKILGVFLTEAQTDHDPYIYSRATP